MNKTEVFTELFDSTIHHASASTFNGITTILFHLGSNKERRFSIVIPKDGEFTSSLEKLFTIKLSKKEGEYYPLYIDGIKHLSLDPQTKLYSESVQTLKQTLNGSKYEIVNE